MVEEGELDGGQEGRGRGQEEGDTEHARQLQGGQAGRHLDREESDQGGEGRGREGGTFMIATPKLASPW